MFKKDKIYSFNYRFFVIVFIFGLFFSIIIARLIFLNQFKKDFLNKQLDLRQIRLNDIKTNRGIIFDRNGLHLAISALTYNVWMDPSFFKKNYLTNLSKILGISKEILESKYLLNKNKKFVYLKRQAYLDSDKIKAIEKIPGVYLKKDSKRYYPYAGIAAHIIGFTDIDLSGIEGLEMSLNDKLVGKKGYKSVVKDRNGRTIAILNNLPKINGEDVITTIDILLQYISYKELKSAVKQNNADGGGLIMVDLNNGDILSLISYPSFNPNDLRNEGSIITRNVVLQDLLEPGSTMKPLLLAMALESGKVQIDDIINTYNGRYLLGKNLIRDDKALGSITVMEVVAKSSNIGAIKLAEKLDDNYFYKKLQELEFNKFPIISMPSLVSDIKNSNNRINNLSMSYGYGLSVTLSHLAKAYTIFKDGNLINLRLLKNQEIKLGKRVISKEVAKQVRKAMEKVVLEGTAKKAKLKYYNVAGKTGTVRKNKGAYRYNEYLSFFIGMLPANNPRFLLAVLIDNPRGDRFSGGDVAAPVFKRIMTNILNVKSIVD